MENIMIRMDLIHRNRGIEYLFFALLLGAFSSCDKSDSNLLKTQTEVKEVIEKFYRAIQDGDKTAFLTCYPQTSEYQQLAVLDYEFYQLQIMFGNALKRVFGKDALVQYENIDLNRPTITIDPPPHDVDILIKEFTIRRQGNTCVASTGSPRYIKVYFELIDGKWLMVTLGNTNLGYYIKELQNYIYAYKEALKDIEKPGITLADLKSKMSKMMYDD